MQQEKILLLHVCRMELFPSAECRSELFLFSAYLILPLLTRLLMSMEYTVCACVLHILYDVTQLSSSHWQTLFRVYI